MHIEHIALWTADIERLKSFYETYFGAKAGVKYINPSRQYQSYFLSFETGARMEIMSMPSILLSKNAVETQYTGYIHIAFSVGCKEAVDSLTERLKRDGYCLLDGPRTTGDGYYESSVLDPDGNRIEITV